MRTDVHRPSVINPADYDFVGYEVLPTSGFDPSGWELLRLNREAIKAHKAKTGGRYSDHEHGGVCHVCGSVNAIYTALFHHKPSNTYIRTGLDCCEKLGWGNAEDFRRKATKAREAYAGKRKAIALLGDAGLAKAWELYEKPLAELAVDRGGHMIIPNEEETVRDIVGKLVKYGSISDKAMNYVRVLLERIEKRGEREAARAAEKEAAAPVPVTDNRVLIVGKVLSMKVVDGPYGLATKMLVKTAPGWKVWGTKPLALECAVGDEVGFEAKIAPSKDDPKFGFFSRPSKARVIEAPRLI